MSTDPPGLVIVGRVVKPHGVRGEMQLAPETKVIVITGQHDRANALKCIELGAYDFCEKPFALPRIAFNPADYAIEQRFFSSKDGTRVPMFLVRRKDLATAGKAVPTILYGYGGFEISLTPSFSAVRMAWLEAGDA